MAEIKRHQIALLSFTMRNFSGERALNSQHLTPTPEELKLFREHYYSIVCSALEIPQNDDPKNLLKLKIYAKADQLLDEKPTCYRGCEKDIRNHFQKNYVGIELYASSEQNDHNRAQEDQGIMQLLANNPDLMFSLTGAGLAAVAFLGACEYISPRLVLTGVFGAIGALGIFGGSLLTAKKMRDRQDILSAPAVNFH